MAHGYELAERLATLVLDDGAYAGAEVEVNLSVGMGVYLSMMRAGADGADAASQTEQTMQAFAAHGLRGWNLLRNGEPVPADYEGLLSVTPDLVAEIIAAWVSAIGGGAAAPLPSKPRASTAGGSTTASRRRPSTAKMRR